MTKTPSKWEGFKTFASYLGIAASLVAAGMAYSANRNANLARLAVEKKQFSIQLFQTSLPYFEKLKNKEIGDEQNICRMLVHLAKVELKSSETNHITSLLKDFLERDIDVLSSETADTLSQCIFDVEGTIVEGASNEPNVKTDPAEVAGNIGIGKWHVVLASYDLNNCEAAKKSAEIMATKFEREVSIFQTQISKHYAVTFDMKSKWRSAQDLRDEVRNVGNEALKRIDSGSGTLDDSYALKFLAGSFLQENKGWKIDDKCNRLERIK